MLSNISNSSAWQLVEHHANESLNDGTVELCTDFWCILQTIIIIVVTILIISTNIADIVIIKFCFDDFDIPEYFMLSLACADLGVGLLITPFSILPAVHHRWLYGYEWCSMAGMLVSIFCSISIYSLMIVSLDRYICIIYPLRYFNLMTKKKCYIMIGVTWLGSIILFLTHKLWLNSFYYDYKSYVCTIDFPHQPHFTIFIVATVVLPPSLILCYIYGKIFKVAARHRQQVRGQPSQRNSDNSVTFSLSIFQTIEWKAAKMYVIIIGAFFVGWLPYSFLQLLLCTTDIQVAQPIDFIIQWLAMANSFWNTIIYFLMHPKYRTACRKLTKALFHRNQITAG